MPWIQIHFSTSPKDTERLEPLLESLGACAVTIMDGADQPLLEPLPGETPLWDSNVVTALMDAGSSPEHLLGELTRQWQGALPPHRIEHLEEQDWERAWIDDFQPMQFGQRLWIVPTWCEPPRPEALNLRLDPGLAFGTGTHETTALCLEWLDGHPSAGLAVLDYGCGSGVLALAALLDGARLALGCDLDPQALLASQDNARSNGVDARLETCLPGDMPEADQQYDRVLANILAGPLCELAPVLAGYCRPGGDLVLSGILAEQADTVMATYAHWFEMAAPAIRGDWVRLSGVRRTGD